MRKYQEYQINDAIDEFLSRNRLKEGYIRMQIATIWNEMLGKVIALSTKKVELEGSTLTVHISSPIVKNELRMLKSDIVAKLNEKAGKKIITEIIIR
jgi:predicted nucleic acid-binding Zn ribbon protein